MDTSTSEAEVQSKSTPDEPTSTNPKSIVVLHTRYQRSAADEHVTYLQSKGNAAVRKQCNDITSFKDMDISLYSRLDMLVDLRMFTILMNEERLHEDAEYKYKEIDEREKELYSINMFGSDFDELLKLIPRNIRKETSLANDYQKMFPATNKTGLGGGTANGATVLGSLHGKTVIMINVNDWNGSYEVKKVENKSEITHKTAVSSGGHENSSEPEVDVRIQVPKEKQEMVLSKIEEQKNELEKVDGVRNVETGPGSIIITFTLEKGHVVTEEWIKGILLILFDDILKSYVSEGEIFRVDVQRRVQYTYNLLNDAKLHENCIMTTEHLKKVDEGRKKIERLRQTEETELTMMDTSTSEAEVQSKSTPDEPTFTNPKTIDWTMATQQQEDQPKVRKQEFDKFLGILDTLISASEKHKIKDAKGTLNRWRKEVQELKTKSEDPPKLKIAVYGKTGGGKSSLLNALYEEPDLLPTSGMGDACTSVIIKIETVKELEHDKGFQAEIVFLTEEEWTKEINLWKKDLEEQSTNEVYQLAQSKLNALYGDFTVDDLDKLIQQRKDITEKIGTKLKIGTFSSAWELQERIEDYIIVKENGQQYWPIVKCVVIRLNNPRVGYPRVVFVDLPGVADSNPVRVQMAEDEKQSARILLVVTRIDRCKASSTAESIVGDEMYHQMKMDQQENVLVCTRTDDVDIKGATRFMTPEEKDVIKALEMKIAECRKRISQLERVRANREKKPSNTLDGDSKENNEESSQLEELRSNEKRINQQLVIQCATLRNKTIIEKLHSNEKRINQQLVIQCATLRNKTIIEKFGKNIGTDIFCISSMDYMKITKDYSGDGRAPVFRDENGTEIPQLRQFLEKKATELYKKQVQDIENHFHSILSETYSYMSNFSSSGKVHLEGLMSEELTKMKSELKKVSQRVGDAMTDVFIEKLFKCIDEGVVDARECAEEICASWGRSTSSVDRGHAFNMYRAIVARMGVFKRKRSLKGHTINFNSDLLNPMMNKIWQPWEEVFGLETWIYLIVHECSKPACDIIEEHAKQIHDSLQVQLDAKQMEAICRIKDDAMSKLQTLTTVFPNLVLPAQKEASRVMVKTVQDMMIPVYEQCVQHTGPGSFERMKTIMQTRVAELKDTMFQVTGDTLKKKLLEIKAHVCDYIEDVLMHIHDAYKQQMTPLWMEHVGQKFLESLVTAKADISELRQELTAKDHELKTRSGKHLTERRPDRLPKETEKKTHTGFSGKKRRLSGSSNVPAKRRVPDIFEVRGSIEFLTEEDKLSAHQFFIQNTQNIKTAFEDQDLVFLGFETSPEFNVQGDFTNKTIQELLHCFPQQGNIHLNLAPKVTMKITARNVQVGSQNTLYGVVNPGVQSEGASSSPSQLTSDFATTDVAEIKFCGTDDELESIEDVLEKLKEMMERPYLTLEVKQTTGEVTLSIKRDRQDEKSLFKTVKTIIKSSPLRILIASETVTVTANLCLTF